ncbi:MAG: hypothetical protein Q8K82_06180, partial [Gemmatimonadaceae bacterium]|nr:hypothetical protein [Gemmatimonadaceae bacterium]
MTLRLLHRHVIAWVGFLAIVIIPQETTVILRVLAETDGSPLINAEVIDRTTGARALTRETGEARVRVPADGS